MAKRYKKYKWAQVICFLLAIMSCVLPPIVATIARAPRLQTTEDKLGLGGVAVFFTAVICLVVCRSLVRKLIAKVPFTLVVLLTLGALLLLSVCLKRIIDEAITMLVIGLTGGGAGFIFEICSIYFGSEAENAKEMYLRGVGDV